VPGCLILPEPEAYLNGRFVPQSAAMVPVYDAGFVLGATVAEQLRTFGGQLFALEAHLKRLEHSLAIVGVNPGIELEELGGLASELVRRNHRLLDAGDDLGLSVFITPGVYPTMVPPGKYAPTVGMHTFPIPFRLWADKYEQGESLATTHVRQVPDSCWPVELKCRSRMHYYLADRAARQIDPQSRAVMLDEAGCVTEATTANIVAYRSGEGLLTPPRTKILSGISMSVFIELAAGLGIPCQERDLTPADLAAADEVFLCSTSPCVLPVVRFDRHQIGQGVVGGLYHQMIDRWDKLVGLDIRAQANRFKLRECGG
jgi:branched-subunit amino acid aminotransferase/4-amino-4-deoxychorismate lyase